MSTLTPPRPRASTIHFRVAGDVSAVTSVRVRVAAAQASDATTVKLDHRSGSDAACRDLVRARSDLAHGAPGIYTIRLTVTDDGGAMTFTSKTLFVGGRGTKPLRNPDNSLVRIDCPAPGASPRSGVAEILVPSYAVDPTATTPNPCPDAGLDTTVTLVKGNATGAMDEWARPRDTLRIAYQLDHAGPGAGGQNVALDWSATWK
jgi:hypothetical protein